MVRNNSPLSSRVFASLLGLSWLLATPVVADFSVRPEVKAWLSEQSDLGFSQEQVVSLLKQSKRQPKVLPVLAKAPESNWVWSDYRKRLLSQQRIKAGRKFMQAHKHDLAQAAADYGVEAQYIAAIAGVETNYGGFTGRFPVLGTLATLAFEHPRRQAFFRKELAHYLRLSHAQGFDPLSVRGSAAGAMGMAQFMPSSYQAYAKDGDDDGVVDLLGNRQDSFASIANYLARHGWQTGVPVLLRLAKDSKVVNLSKKPKKGGDSLSQWQQSGVSLAASTEWPKQKDANYRLYQFSTHKDPEYILATGNFYAITRYNHSLWYARLVAELAEAIDE